MAYLCLFFLLLFLPSSLPAQSVSPETESLVREGQTALASGNLELAIQVLERANRLTPAHREVISPLLSAYLQAGRLLDAIHLGQESTKLFPNNAELHHLLGLAYFKTQENTEAQSELQQAARLAEDSSDKATDSVPELVWVRRFSEL